MTDSYVDTQFMHMALNLARQAGERGEVPVGAVIVRDNSIIAEGANLVETNFDASAHAELLAIRSASSTLANWRLEGCTLYVSLEPCPMCGMAIRLARLSRVVYGARDPRMGGHGSFLNLFTESSIGPLPHVLGGVLAEESSALLKEFFRKRRK